MTLSPLRYHFEQRAEIEAVVQGADRDAAFDTLTASIGAALAAEGTLGGLCDRIEAGGRARSICPSRGRLVEAFGDWLKAAFGAPATAGTTPRTHSFQSGNWAMPSMPIEVAMPEVT